MILLTTTSDTLRLMTSDASSIDVHTDWADQASGSVTPGRTNSIISTATTTTIVGSPTSAGVFRTVKAVRVRNRHATQATQVAILHRDSTPTEVELIRVSLAPGRSLVYEENRGWYVTAEQGLGFQYRDGVFVAPAIGELFTQVLSTDYEISPPTANQLLDVPDLAFAVVTGCTYYFKFHFQYTSSASTTGSKWSIYGPGGASMMFHRENSSTATSKSQLEGFAVYDAGAQTANSPASLAGLGLIEGFITPTNDGLVFFRASSAVASPEVITLLAGSNLQWQRVL